MHNIAKADSSKTLQDFWVDNQFAKSIFPEGVPKKISSPGWSSYGNDEMSVCQRKFFDEWADRIPEVPLDSVVQRFDCIGFMDAYLASDWIQMWMCACYYSAERNDICSQNIGEWTMLTLKACLKANSVVLPSEAVVQFVEDFGGHPEDDPEMCMLIACLQAAEKSK